ncbi:protein FAR1-RELATED SEQUENCE 5-like [Salvia divinorum]|uniref:Protein FAR1-RELATED SEQUENCE 5-like n=1 Tax=Salvia divinorum TaxID=28513 RepID=A0ABD1FQ13_SALDI
MVEVKHKQFMSLNRKLDDVHEKFILDCSKANIRPMMTFKFLKEMVLDEMRRKEDLSESFTYHYEVNSSNQLEALFWCDGQSKRNYHMFGDVVAFNSTYNTNRYCMIFTPFTGKDNHRKPVTFAAGLCNTDTLHDFATGMKDLCNRLDSDTTSSSALGKRRMAEDFYGMARPELVEVHPPEVVKTKGSCSSKGSRMISQREKAIREFNKPLRKCATCQELGHYDSRNCARVKAKEKDNAKGKEKC